MSEWRDEAEFMKREADYWRRHRYWCLCGRAMDHDGLCVECKAKVVGDGSVKAVSRDGG